MEGPRDGDIEGAKVVAMVSQSASGNEPPIGHFQRGAGPRSGNHP